MRSETRRRVRYGSWTGALAVLLAVAAWAVGVSWPQALLLAAALAAGGTALTALDLVAEEPALSPPAEGSSNEGTRREVFRLSWAMAGPDHRVGDVPYRRLRAVAATRLALRGVDLSTPEGLGTARALLGPVAYEELVAEATGTPSERVFAGCLERLELLDERPGEPQPPTGDVEARMRR